MLEDRLGAGDLGPAGGVHVGLAISLTSNLKIRNVCFLEH